MVGWEELTPDQLILIFWGLLYMVTVYVASTIVNSFIHLKISNNIKLRVKKELLKEVRDQIDKPPLFNKIKLWWSERKMRKELYRPFEPSKKERY